MYVQPVALRPNTPPWASASGSTASAAIGQIVAMNVVTSMSRRKCRVDTTYATSSSIAIRPKTFPSSDASPFGRRAEQDERHATEREQREQQRARVDVLTEQPRARRHDEERCKRPDQRGVGDAVVRRAGEEDGEVQSEEHAGHERLPHVGHRDPPTCAPQHEIPDDADHDHAPEGDQHSRRLGALDECRAEREGDDQADDCEHAQRLRAPPGSRHCRRRHVSSPPIVANVPVSRARTRSALATRARRARPAARAPRPGRHLIRAPPHVPGERSERIGTRRP